jgi:SAM-dependent methyltransferase
VALQDDVLEDLAEAVNYRYWLVDLALPFLGDDPLEVGSGIGLYAADWRAAGVPRLTVSEADAGRLEVLRERFADDSAVIVRELAVPIAEQASYSSVVAYNVLEHVEDDIGAVAAFRGLVRPGGRVVVLVPAFPSALGRFDRDIGHHRRYRKRTLRSAAASAGLEVEVLRHVNGVGLLGWYVVVRLLRGRPRAGLLLKVYDAAVVPLLRRVESRWEPPFGQSLLLVARRG